MKALLQNVGEITLAGALRAIGAMVVVAALCANLLQGWDTWSGVDRYYAMFGVTGLLALAGLATSYLLNEQKSARVFVGLALLAVLANVTTVGGLINEYVQFDGALSSHPQMRDWSIGAGVSLLGVLASALFVLLPVTGFAYRVLARGSAKRLTLGFVLLASLILVPLRTSWALGILLVLALVVPIYLIRQLAGRELGLQTLEGRYALATLFAPLVIMLGRLLWLYEADALLHLIICGVAYACVHYVNLALNARSPLRLITISVALVLSFAMALTVCDLLPVAVDELSLALFAAVAGAGVAGVGLSQVHGRRLYLRGGAAIGVLGLLPGLFSVAGAVDLTNWLTLAVLGFAVLIAAAVLERLRRRGEPG